MTNTFLVSGNAADVVKIMYAVIICGGNGDSANVLESDNEALARERYAAEVKQAGEAVDVTGWTDGDQAWPTVYNVELAKIMYDEDGDIVDIVTIEQSDYYHI